MDPGSLLRHRRKTEGSPGLDGMAEKGPWERPAQCHGVAVESVKQFSEYLRNGLPWGSGGHWCLRAPFASPWPPLPLVQRLSRNRKRVRCRPRSHGDSGPQKEPMIPGIMDFKLIREAVRTSKPQTPSAYRFGRSATTPSSPGCTTPQPQHVTHIQGRLG